LPIVTNLKYFNSKAEKAEKLILIQCHSQAVLCK